MTSHIPRCVAPLLLFLLLSSLAAAQSAVDLGDSNVSPVFMTNARGVRPQRLEEARNLKFQEFVAAGTRFYENAEFAKALTWYERAQRLDPENASLKEWSESARRNLEQQTNLRQAFSSSSNLNKEVKERYRRACEFFDQREFEKARSEFWQVWLLAGNYESTRDYLTRIGQAAANGAEIPTSSESAYSASQGEIRLAQGKDLLDAKRYDLAASLFNEVLAADPQNPKAVKYLAKAEKGAQRMRDAQAREEARVNEEKAYQEAMRTQEEQRKAQEGQSARIEGFLAQAEAALGESRFDEAKQFYDEVAALDAGNRAAQRGLASLAESRAQAEAGRAEAERKAEERRIDEILAKADALFAQRDYENALKTYQDARAASPEDSRSGWRLRASRGERAADGIAESQNRLEMAKQEGERAESERAEFERQRAAESERNAKQKEIEDAVAQAQSLFDKGAYEESLNAYEVASTLDSTDRRVSRGLKDAQKAMARAQEARAYEQASIRQDKIDGALAQAAALTKAGDFDRAVEAYQSVLKLDAENRKAQRGIAKVEKSRKAADERAEEATLEEQRRVAQSRADEERQARESTIVENIETGNVLFDNRRYERAIESYQAALDLDPRNKVAQAGIEKAKKAQDENSRAQLAEALRQSAIPPVSASDEGSVPDLVVAQADAAEPAPQPSPEATAAPAAQPADEEDDVEFASPTPATPEEAAEEETPEAAPTMMPEAAPTMAPEAAPTMAPEAAPVETAPVESAEPSGLPSQPESPETAEMPETAVAPIAAPEEPASAEPEFAAPVSPEPPVAEPAAEAAETAVPAVSEEEPTMAGQPVAESAAAAEIAAQDEGKDAATLVEEAGASIEEARWEEAVRKLTRALELEPGNRKAEKLLKKANKGIEKSIVAKSAEGRADIDDSMRKADASYKAKDLADARALWNQIVARDPENKAAKTMLEETEAEYQRMLADQEAREKAAEAERAAKEKLQTPIPLIRTSEALPLREFLQTLSLASGVDFTVTEGSDTQINGSFVDKTLEEILDSVLLPIGLKWEIQKGDIIVVSPDLKTKLFHLNEAQMSKVQALIDNKSIQRLVWGPSGEKPLKGTVLQLEPRQNVLIVQDSQQSIEKLDAFLKDLGAEQPTELVTRVYRIDPALGPEIKGLVEAIIQTEKTPFNLERGVWVSEERNLIVRDTASHLEQIEAMLQDKGFIKNLLDQHLQLETFSLIPRDALKGDTELALNFALQTKEVIETFLYAEEGMAAAKQAGRRMWFDPSTLQLTITDTRENIDRVAGFIDSLPQIKQEELKKIIFLKHVISSEMISNINEIFDLVSGGAAAAGGAGETVTKTLRTEQEITYRDLIIRLLRVNDNAPEDDLDNSCEMIVRTSTQRINITLTKFDSQFVDDYEILADDVRPAGESGTGNATLKIRYMPTTAEAARPGGALAVPTPTPAPAAGPMKPILKEFGPQNAMIIRYENPKDLKTIEDLVREFDKPTPQVDISTKFVQVNEQRAKELSSEFTFTDLQDPRLNLETGFLDPAGQPLSGLTGIAFQNQQQILNRSTFGGGFGTDYDELRSVNEPPIENPFLGSNLLKGTTAIDIVLGRFLGTQVENQLRLLEAEGIVNVVNGPHIVVMDSETANFEIQRDSVQNANIINTQLPDGMMQVNMIVQPQVTSVNSILLTLNVEIADYETVRDDYQYQLTNEPVALDDLYTRAGTNAMWRRIFTRRATYNRGNTSLTNVGNYGVRTSESSTLSMNRQRKWVRTSARIKDGGTIVLGGWTGEYAQDLTSGVPGLRNLPWVGKLFFSRSQSSSYKTTLLIFLSGKIIE